MRKQHWYVYPGAYCAFGLSFPHAFRRQLCNVAACAVQDPEIRMRGPKKPIALAWLGQVYGSCSVPGEILEDFLYEFGNVSLGPLLPIGIFDEEPEEDGQGGGVYMEFAATDAFYKYRDMVTRLLKPFANTTAPVEDWSPIVRLGARARSEFPATETMEIQSSDLFPNELLFGTIEENGFAPIVSRVVSDRDVRWVYTQR